MGCRVDRIAEGRSGNLQRSFAALGKLVLLGDALERLVDRLDAIEKVAAFGGKQTQDLVSACRERAAQPSGLVVDELADFVSVLRHGHLVSLRPVRHSSTRYRAFFLGADFVPPMPGPRSKGDVCAAGLGFSTLGFRFSRLLF
jgi:hypothetical protein